MNNLSSIDLTVPLTTIIDSVSSITTPVIPIIPCPPISKQPSIDQITMELMMNRSHYKKYLAKQDPNKYQENQEYINKIKKYKLKITNIMLELLDDSVKSNVSEKYTRDINDTFNVFLKTCVKHFEIYELQSNFDTDTLFDQLDNIDSNNDNLSNPSVFVKPHYTMDMFANKSRL